MTREPLEVHLYGRCVASLIDAGFGDTALQYTEAALDAPDPSRLSLSLPVRRELYPFAGPGGRWARSLLPEGRALDWAVAAFGIPADDRFGLIAMLGRDVAGAVQIVEAGTDPQGVGRFDELSDTEASAHVLRSPQVALGLDRARGVRLSLAGVQDKVLLHRVRKRWFLPVDGAPSTLIIKPEPIQPRPDGLTFPGLATNELYCLLLARACRLRAAEAAVERFDGIPALVVKRFDRDIGPDGSITRLQQEDLLGVLGADPLLKYEVPHTTRVAQAGGWGTRAADIVQAGPSLRDIATVLRRHLGSAQLVNFLRFAAFNLLIGNADAHARNYSVILPPTGVPEFAPLYDTVCTRLWPELDRAPAQRVNGLEDIDEITFDDIAAEAESWGIPLRVAERAISQLAANVEKRSFSTVDACVRRGGDVRVATAVADQVRARFDAMSRT